MYLNRTIEPAIIKAQQQFPVLMVTGPRQVGKTTLLQHLALNNRHYVSLDDPVLQTLAKEEPKLFLQRYKPPLLIDEIQYGTELLPYIKMDVDQHRQQSGRYWLAGSQPFHLMRGVTESLAGRVGLINLLGLSQWETKQLANISTPFVPTRNCLEQRLNHAKSCSLSKLYQAIWRGCYPAMVSHQKMNKDLFYSAYIQTYLQRDLHDLAQVGNHNSFFRFLRIAAARTGQIVNMADMARDADISTNTAKHWLSILQASNIIYLLQPYYNNITKRLIKSPKLYFIDTGLCSYLTQWSNASTLEAGAMSGAILETFVITEIIKSYWHNGLQAPLYYYRDKDKREIDLLIVKDQTVYPIEIKKTASPKKEAIKHFNLLQTLNLQLGDGALICLVDTILPISTQTHAIPVNLI